MKKTTIWMLAVLTAFCFGCTAPIICASAGSGEETTSAPETGNPSDYTPAAPATFDSGVMALAFFALSSACAGAALVIGNDKNRRI